ncbi:uncharacterized protein [Dysidea avara]|uniref:uncharacterized protein n=1 Tax=Dysidea avara TaxID=196820 RepID=UPI00333051D7
MMSTAPTKEGEVSICTGRIIKSWKRCYLSLQTTYLHVNETKDSPTHMETILRMSIKKASQCGIDSFSFKIEFDNRSDMLLQATPEIEVRRWIYALTWHNLPEDKRDIVPTEDDPPPYDAVTVQSRMCSIL